VQEDMRRDVRLGHCEKLLTMETRRLTSREEMSEHEDERTQVKGLGYNHKLSSRRRTLCCEIVHVSSETRSTTLVLLMGTCVVYGTKKSGSEGVSKYED
jgi:hypothetical protein